MEISNFFNIKIKMQQLDPLVPSFIATYQDYKIVVDIENIEVIEGHFPRTQYNLTLGWCAMYKEELMQNWKLMLEGKLPLELQGLRKY